MARTNLEKVLNQNVISDDPFEVRDIDDISFILDHQKISLKNIFTVGETVSLYNKDEDVLSHIDEDMDFFTDINISNIDNNYWNLDRILEVDKEKLNKLFKTRSGNFLVAHQGNIDKFIKEKISPLEIEIERKYIDNFFINDENSIITINSLKIKDQNDNILSEINGKNFSGHIQFNDHLNLEDGNVSNVNYISDENVHQSLIGFKKKKINNVVYEDNYITSNEDKIKISFLSHIVDNLSDIKIELDFNLLTPYQYESIDSQVKLSQIREGIIEGLRSTNFENGIDVIGDYPRELNIDDINDINNIVNNATIIGELTTVLNIDEIEEINEIINGESEDLSISVLQQNDINKIINNIPRNNDNNIILNEKQIEDINEIINDISLLTNISSLTLKQKNNIDKITQLIENVLIDKNIEYLTEELFDENDGLIKRLEELDIDPIIPSSNNSEGFSVLETYIKNKRLEVGNTSELRSLDYKFSLLFNSLNLNHYTKIDFTNIKNMSGINIENQTFYGDNDIKFKLTNEKEVKVARLKVLVDFAKIKDNSGYIKFRDQDKLNEEDDIGELYIDINKNTLEPTGSYTKGKVIDIQPNITNHILLTDTSTSRINLKPKIITNEFVNIDQYGNKTIDEDIVKLDLYTDELIDINGELVKDYFEKNKKLKEERIDTSILESKEREIRNMLIHEIDVLLDLEKDTDQDVDLKILNVLNFVDQTEFNISKIKNRTTRQTLILLNSFMEKYEITLFDFEDSSITDSNEIRNADIEIKLTSISQYLIENTITSDILKEINEIYIVTHDRLGYNSDKIYELLDGLASIINKNIIKEPFINEHKLYKIKHIDKKELHIDEIEKDDIYTEEFYVNSIKLKPIVCKDIKVLDNNILDIEDISSLITITEIDEEEDESINEILCSPNPLPFANAGDHRSILSGLTIILDGSKSYSPQGDIISYLWEEIKDVNNEQVFEHISNKMRDQVKSDELEPGSLSVYRFFQLTVTNDSGETDTDIVIITVESPNAPPVANAGSDQLVLSGSTVVIDSNTSTDKDGSIVSWTWSRIGGTGDSTIIDNSVKDKNRLTFTADTLEIGSPSVTHEFSLEVVDDEGAKSSNIDKVIITVQSPNILPVAHAGFDQIVDDETEVTLNGTRSKDRGFESGIVSYNWVRTGGTGSSSVTLDDPTSKTPKFTTEALTAGIAPVTHIFTLTITDTRNATSTDTVTVTVISPNIPPVANAGNDQIVTSGSEVTLDGSNSEDDGHDGEIISYHWERIDGSSKNEITLSDPNIVNPTFIADTLEDGSRPVTHIFRLTVTDNRASVVTDDNEPSIDTDEVMITIMSNNILPIVDAGQDQIVGSVVTVTLNGSASDSGYSSGISSYLWERIDGTGKNVTLTNPTTLTPTFVTELLDQGSSTVSHIFRLTVTDTNGATATDTVTIFVDAPNAPPVANAGPDQTVLAEDVVMLDGSGTDIDSNDENLTYSWEHVGGSNSRQITLTNPTTLTPTFTADSIIAGYPNITQVFELTVTDSENASHKDTVIITIESENAEPFALIETPHQTVASNTIVTLDGSRSFDPDGEIISYHWERIGGTPNKTILLTDPESAITTFRSDTLDAGIASIKHIFRLTVVDNEGLTAYADTIIIVDSPNIGPTVNAGSDQTVTSGDTVNLNAIADDPDGDIVSYLWEQVGGTGEIATLSSTSISNPTFTAQTLEAGSDPVIQIFQITVTDNDNGKATDSIMIITRSQNIPPVSVPGPTQIVPHRSRVQLDGSKSFDRGFNSSIEGYQWTSDVNNDPQVTLINADKSKASFISPKLEPGSDDLLYYFNLEVTDNENATHSEKVCIIIEPPNAPPVANAGPDQNVNYNSMVILNGSGSDVDGNIVSYNWKRIRGTGDPSIEISNVQRPVFTSDNLSVNDNFVTHVFELTVTDNEGLTATDTVMIIVHPPKDPPHADAGISRRVEHNTLIQLDGSRSYDRGYNAGIVSYKWEGNVELSDPNIVNPTFRSETLEPNAPSITHEFKLTVTDKAGEIDTDTVTIIVDAPNAPPKAVAKISIDGELKDTAYIPSETEVSLDGSSSQDPDGTITGYTWRRSGGTSGQNVTLENPNTATPTFTTDTLSPGAKFITHIFELTVTDGIDTNIDYVTIVVESPNVNPIANAGNNQEVKSGTQVQLNGSGSYDPNPNGEIVSYNWEWIDEGSSGNPYIALSDPNIATPTFIADHLIQGSKSITHRFKLTVTNNKNNTNEDIVIIIVDAPNSPPVAILNDNQDVISGSTVQLDGSKSYDIDGTINSYLWERIGGTGDSNIALSNTNIINPTFVADRVVKLNSSVNHVFKLTVTDNEGLMNTDTTIVNILSENQSPIANINEYKIVNSGEEVELDGSSSYDPDGEIVSYTWAKKSNNDPDGYIFSFDNPNAIKTKFKAPNLVPGTSSLEMCFTLMVTDDDGITNTKDTNVIVQSPNIGPLAYAGEDQVVDHSTQVTLDGSDSRDYGIGYIKSYSWRHLSVIPSTSNLPILSTTDEAIITFTSNALTVDDTDIVHVFELTVTDNKDATNTDIVQVRVKAPIPVNNAPLAKALIQIKPNTYTSYSKVKPSETVQLNGLKSTDPDGDKLKYNWRRISGTNHSAPTLSDPNIANPTFVANELEIDEHEICHIFQLTVTDKRGLTDTDNVTILIESPNIPPVANAGSDQTVLHKSVVKLDGSASYDTKQGSRGRIVSYAWERIGGSGNSDIKLQNETEMIASFTTETLNDGDGYVSHSFLLTVKDDKGLTDTDIVIVNVKAPNQKQHGPYAYAGNYIYVEPGETVQLNGYGSFVRPGEIVSYHWEQRKDSKFSNTEIKLSDPNIANPTFIANDANQGSINNILRLTVTDNYGNTDYDEVVVIIRSSRNKPMAKAGPDQTVRKGETVKLNGLESSSPSINANIIFYSWEVVGGTYAKANLKDADTPTPTFIAAGYGISSNIIIELTVIDDFGSVDKDIVVITVINTNSHPTARAGVYNAVRPNSRVQLDGTASTSGFGSSSGEIVSYNWEQYAGSEEIDIINPNTATPHFISGSKFGYYLIRLTVTDDLGNTDSDTKTISVSDPDANINIDIGPDRSGIQGETIRFSANVEDLETIKRNFKYNWTIYSDGDYAFENNNKDIIENKTTLTPHFILPMRGNIKLPVDYYITLWISDIDNPVYVLNTNNTIETPKYSQTIRVTSFPERSKIQTLFADAGLSQIGYFNSTIQLNGSNSTTYDPDRRIVSYHWERQSSKSGFIPTLSNPNIANPTIVTKSVPLGSPYSRHVFRLTVTDDIGNMDYDEVTIIVHAPKEYPGINLGNIQSIKSGTTGVIDISSDLFNRFDINEMTKDRYTYEWIRIAGTGDPKVKILNIDTSTPSLIGDTLEKGSKSVTHVFRLIIRLKDTFIGIIKVTIIVISERKDNPSIISQISDTSVPFINRIIPSKIHYTPTPRIYPIKAQSGYTYYRTLILTHGISRNNILYRGLNNHITGYTNKNSNLKKSTQNLNINDIKYILNNRNFNNVASFGFNYESGTFFNFETYPLWIRIKDDETDIRQSGKFIIAPNNQNGHLQPIPSTEFKKISYRENYGFDLGNGIIDRFYQGNKSLYAEEQITPAWATIFSKSLNFFGPRVNITYLNSLIKYNNYTYIIPIDRWPLEGIYSSKLITIS